MEFSPSEISFLAEMSCRVQVRKMISFASWLHWHMRCWRPHFCALLHNRNLLRPVPVFHALGVPCCLRDRQAPTLHVGVVVRRVMRRHLILYRLFPQHETSGNPVMKRLFLFGEPRHKVADQQDCS